MASKRKLVTVEIDSELIALGLGILCMWTALIALGGYLIGYEPFPCAQTAYNRCVAAAARSGDVEQLQRCEYFREVRS